MPVYKWFDADSLENNWFLRNAYQIQIILMLLIFALTYHSDDKCCTIALKDLGRVRTHRVKMSSLTMIRPYMNTRRDHWLTTTNHQRNKYTVYKQTQMIWSTKTKAKRITHSPLVETMYSTVNNSNYSS